MDVVRAAGLLQPDQTVAGHPVSLSQAFALHELDTDTPLSQRDLAERLRLEKSSVSRDVYRNDRPDRLSELLPTFRRLAAEMERKGLLVRERDPDNHRQYRLRLTDHGRATHVQMRTTFHEQYECWVAAMTHSERAALLTGLPALVRVIRQHVR